MGNSPSALAPGKAEPALSLQAQSDAAKVNAAAASFARLTALLDYLSAAELSSVKQAYRFADQAHLGQLRNSGEPYITHPIEVAAQCAQWKLDPQALMAALLHDVVEDCGVSKLDLIESFGAPVAELVDGLTKLEKLHFNTREESQAESFRKMLLAMARDVRVILIKLADRTHNMRTLGGVEPNKWHRIASETLDIYAPIAHRLGLNQTYRELQDLSFRYLHPWRYAILTKAVARARSHRRDLIKKVQTDLQSTFTRQHLPVKIAGREKTLYSIYKKMVEKDLSFAQVTDIYGFRVIVPLLIDCYTALGMLHQLYQPVPGKFKDHIAITKINGYQSLHTTLVGPAGINVEFQLRTPAMHQVAETGVAAHWLYKESQQPELKRDERMGSKWLQSLLEIQHETRDASEFWDHVKMDLFPDAVYVFTPKNKILSLPRGATVVDFAYAIHSKVGNHAVSAKVNNEEVALRTEVRNGDVIDVTTATQACPNPAWLGFVRTARARSKIRQYLKSLAQIESQNLGEKMLLQALRAEGFDELPVSAGDTQATWDKLLRFTGNHNRGELLTDIGLGKRVATILAKRLAKLMIERGARPDTLLITHEHYASGEAVAQGSVMIDGSESTSVRFAKCCKPIPGDKIVGYLGRGEGLMVHVAACPSSQKLQLRDADRFISVEWADEIVRSFETDIVVTVNNGKGVLAKVAAALAAAQADITHIDMNDDSGQGIMDIKFAIAVHDLAQFETVMRYLRHMPEVLKAQRSNSVRDSAQR